MEVAGPGDGVVLLEQLDWMLDWICVLLEAKVTSCEDTIEGESVIRFVMR